MGAKLFEKKWQHADTHLDSNITPESFMSSARCIIYAAPVGSLKKYTKSDFHRIGVVQNYNWTEQRQLETIFELGSDVPYLIPGRTVGSISLSRILIYGSDLLNILYYGTNAMDAIEKDGGHWLRSLKDVDRPINIMFSSYANDNSTVYSRVFTNCWIESRSENVSSNQIIIAEQCNIRYTDCIKCSLTKTSSSGINIK